MFDYVIQFWALALVIFVVLLELLTRAIDQKKEAKNKFSFETMPVLQPARIPTEGKGVVSALWTWVMKSRKWRVAEDFYYKVNDVDYVIPEGVVCNVASIPKFLRAVISPTGILLVGALVHDHGYKYTTLRYADGSETPRLDQKYLDQLFRDINIQVNGFKAINHVAYYALRLFGWVAWIKHRIEDKKWDKE